MLLVKQAGNPIEILPIFNYLKNLNPNFYAY